MACRVGITTNLEERKQHWMNRCAGFDNWRVLTESLSREAAQKKESAVAKSHGCIAHHGGSQPDSPTSGWYVYHFTYTRER